MKKIIILFCIAIITAIPNLPSSSYAVQPELLIITENFHENEVVTVFESPKEPLYNFAAIAVRKERVMEDATLKYMLREALQRNCKIYVYGDISVKEFKELLDLQIFEIGSGLDENNIQTTETVQFTQEQEEKPMGFISYSLRAEDSYTIAARLPLDFARIEEAIIADYLETKPIATRSFEIASSMVHLKTYGFEGNFYDFTHYLDTNIILYKDTGDIDTNYDYYVVESVTNVVGDKGKTLSVRHKSLSDVLDYSPKSVESTSTITISLGIAGIDGSFPINANPSVSGAMGVDGRYDCVDWTIGRYWLAGQDIDTNAYTLASKWRNTQDGSGGVVIRTEGEWNAHKTKPEYTEDWAIAF